MPVTPTSTPSIEPTVPGTIVPRSEASAAFDVASVLDPAIGRSIWATVRALFTLTSTG